MPTIEIASVNSPGINLRQEDYKVTIIENRQLKSHRPLFNDFLKDQNGTMIHVGNPDYRDCQNNLFYAGAIIDWEFEPVEVNYYPSIDDETYEGGGNQQMRFKFLEQFRKDIDNLMRAALDSSPVQKGFLFSNYHFGPEKEIKEVGLCISDLWLHHDENGLVFNTIYVFCGK